MIISKRTKMLLDLPHLIYDRHHCDSDELLEEFVRDRDSLPSPEYLKPFVEKWRNLWLLMHPNSDHLNNLSPGEVVLLNEDYDEEEVFVSLINNEGWTGRFMPHTYAESIQYHITMPTPARWALRTADKLDCGSDHIFVRTFLDPYGLDTACVLGSGDTRLKLIESIMES